MHYATRADIGKLVVNNLDQPIGRVCWVVEGTAIVETDPGLTDSIRGRLGWEEPGRREYRLEPAHIHAVTDRKLKLG